MLSYCAVTLTVFRVWLTALGTSAEVRPCEPEAWEEETYTVNCSSPTGRGSYAWYVRDGSRKTICKAAPGSTSCPDGRITAVLKDNRSQTNLTFRPVKAEDRGKSVTCTSFLNYSPFKHDVISCTLQVLSKPLSTSCAVNRTSASIFQLKCTAVRVFPDIVCNITMTREGVLLNAENSPISYEFIKTVLNGVEYRTAGCSADFKNMLPGNYTATVAVYVAALRAGGNDPVKECHRESFKIIVTRPYAVLTQTRLQRCLANDQTTLSAQLKCEVYYFNESPNVTWYRNGSKVTSKKNGALETHEGKFHVTSWYKFQPSASDGSTDITCNAQSVTERATVTFRIPEYPRLPPQFVNATEGVLILSEGRAEIECRVPGGQAFNKIRVRCFVNGAVTLDPSPQQGGVARVRIPDARSYDQAFCNCTADHSFFCYGLVVGVVIRVNGHALDLFTIPGDADRSTTSDGPRYEVAYIALATAGFLLIIFVLGFVFSVAHRKFKKSRKRDSSRCRYVNEHIYCDPDENPLGRSRSHQRSMLPDVISDSHATFYREDATFCHSLSSISTSDCSWMDSSSIDSYTAANYINISKHTGERPENFSRSEKDTKSRHLKAHDFSHDSHGAHAIKAHRSQASLRVIYITPLSSFSSDSFKAQPQTSDFCINQEKGSELKVSAKEAKSLSLDQPAKHSFQSTGAVKRKSKKRKDAGKHTTLNSARKSKADAKHDNSLLQSKTDEGQVKDADYLELLPMNVRESRGDNEVEVNKGM
ncbi:hypothetical protein Btru_072042 [Bulinus truncatus]|nr:hypothetical protein Btru_072042 [Bulinus truncatus]